MKRKAICKAIIALAVAMAFVMPVAAFANVGTIGVISNSDTGDIENIMVESTNNDANYNQDTIIVEKIDTMGITIYVDDDAVPPYDGTPEHPYRYIQQGIDNATAGAGDTIYVLNGTYYENVLVTKQLDLVGESRENVIVDGSGGSDTFKVSVENVSITTFSVTNSTRGFQIRYGSYCTVTDCDVYNNSGHGFYMVKALNCNIVNCDIYNSGIAFLAYWCDAANITNCNMYDNSKGGIHLAHLTGWTLKNNIICNTTAPLGIRTQDWLVEQFRHDIDASNTIDGEPIYYLVGQSDMVLDETDVFSYVGLVDCTNITVKNSDVRGILLANTTDSTFFNVTTHDAHTGIYQFESSYNSFTNCDVYNNIAMGIQFQYSPNNNITGCDVYDNEDMGIKVDKSGNINIVNCDSYGNDNGIDIWNFLVRVSIDIVNCNTYNNDGYGIHLQSSSDNNNIIDCNSYNNSNGIYLQCMSDNNITNCNAYNNSGDGIRIASTSDNNIINCKSYNNFYGIIIWNAPNSCLRDNDIYNNIYDFSVDGSNINVCYQDIDTSNTVNGKPIWYLVEQSNTTLDGIDLGYLGLISCTNITAKNSDTQGILIANTTDSTISNVSSHNSVNGIYFLSSSNNNIAGCDVYDNDNDGISLSKGFSSPSIDNKISNCNVYNNNNGICIMESSGNNIINCNAYDNNYGIQIAYDSSNCNITNCNVYNNNYYGIYLWWLLNTHVTNCDVYNNNYYGIYLAWSADGSFIHHNNFVNNVFGNAYEEYCGLNTWDDGSEGNYWDDYTGVDEDGNGIGDTPYNITGGSNQDRYPLMNPLDEVPPVTTDIQATPEMTVTDDPVNITCTVTDNWDLVDIVKVNITGPEGFTLEVIMDVNESNYWYEDTYTTLGIYYYFIWANDLQGNIAVSDTYSFVITEFDKPISAVDPLPTWETVVPFTVTATAFDNTGVATVTLWSRYSTDGTVWTDWTSYGIDEAEPWEWEFTGSDGYYEFYSIAVDDYANVEDTPSTADTSTGLDTVLPVTTIILDGTMGKNGWYISDVTVTLSATDDLSGVESIWYWLDSGHWNRYTIPFTVSQGQHILKYFSIDWADNRDEEQSVDIKIDMTIPTTTYEFDGLIGECGWFVTNVNVTLSAEDVTPGVNYTMYKLNDGDWITYVDPFVVTENGDHTLYYYSVDLAGNTEATNEVDFKIEHDIVPPVTTHEFDGTIGDNDWYTSNVMITLTAEDDLAGVDYTMYKLDNSNWQKYLGPILVVEDGDHTITYYSVDRVGNEEDPCDPVDFKIDQTNPTIDLKAEKTGLMKWLLTATVSDATSGIAKVQFFLKGELLGEVTEPPYEWTCSGKGKAQAIVYDNAGNTEISDEVDVVSQSQSQSSSSTQLWPFSWLFGLW